MSAGNPSPKSKGAWEAVKQGLEKAETAAQKAFNRAAPAVQKTLDTSLDATAKGFNATLRTIDSRTEREQMDLLQVYRKFLAAQVGYLDSRIKSLEERGASKKAPDPEPADLPP
jgi:hypothetical protein